MVSTQTVWQGKWIFRIIHRNNWLKQWLYKAEWLYSYPSPCNRNEIDGSKKSNFQWGDATDKRSFHSPQKLSRFSGRAKPRHAFLFKLPFGLLIVLRCIDTMLCDCQNIARPEIDRISYQVCMWRMRKRLTCSWLTTLNHGMTEEKRLACREFRAATPCRWGETCDIPYKGSPLLTFSTISRVSISTSLEFSVNPWKRSVGE